MSSPSKRREMDVMKLMMSDYNVETITDGLNEFNVEFPGLKESLYEGGVWKIHVELPESYPYLLNVFEVFLSQLLLYPNPSDPFNGDAASLMMKDKKQYDLKVKDMWKSTARDYAKKENITNQDEEDSDDEDISSRGLGM